jgi:hypothetical protein
MWPLFIRDQKQYQAFARDMVASLLSIKVCKADKSLKEEMAIKL